ncbi:response regulator [Thioalkalivibrio sp.]|uniref:response regulator n=1 Tax=Thioalkalivibrio sp. TaxID=2093813 RepID=UPI003974C813
MSIRIVLADRHPIVIEGLRSLIGNEPDMEIIEACDTGAEALERVRQDRPDILLMGMNLADIDGLEVLRQLRDEGASTRIVFFVTGIDDEEAVEAMRLRVEGILLKEMPTRLVLQCIRKVHDGGRWLETKSMARVVERLQEQENSRGEFVDRLSPREQEVTRLVMEGLNNKDIAARLSLSVGTIKIHLHNIYEKLGIRSRLQLAAQAREKGFD